MSWIGDVIPRTTIRTTWGNAMRNQLVQRFSTPTERDAQAQPRQSGMLAWTDQERGYSYVDSDGTTWRRLQDSLPAIPVWRRGYHQYKLGYVSDGAGGDYDIENGNNALYIPFTPAFPVGSNVTMNVNPTSRVGWFCSVGNVTPNGGLAYFYSAAGEVAKGSFVGAMFVAFG